MITDLHQSTLFTTIASPEQLHALEQEIAEPHFAKDPKLRLMALLLSKSKVETSDSNSVGYAYVRECIKTYPDTAHLGIYFEPEEIRKKAWQHMNAGQRDVILNQLGKNTLFGQIPLPPKESVLAYIDSHDDAQWNWSFATLFNYIAEHQLLDDDWIHIFEQYNKKVSNLSIRPVDVEDMQNIAYMAFESQNAINLIVQWLKEPTSIPQKSVNVPKNVSTRIFQQEHISTMHDLLYAIAARIVNTTPEKIKKSMELIQSIGVDANSETKDIWSLMMHLQSETIVEPLEPTI